jgi:hypothetical protein
MIVSDKGTEFTSNAILAWQRSFFPRHFPQLGNASVDVLAGTLRTLEPLMYLLRAVGAGYALLLSKHRHALRAPIYPGGGPAWKHKTS